MHTAAQSGKVGCVKVLLSAPGIDVNIQNSYGNIALKLATKYEVLTMLQKYSTSCGDYPIHSFGKAILCGDTGSGKSTLAQVITIYVLCLFSDGNINMLNPYDTLFVFNLILTLISNHAVFITDVYNEGYVFIHIGVSL